MSAPPLLESIASSRARIVEGSLSVADLVRSFLDRIAERDETLRGFSLVTADDAVRQADALDRALRDGAAAGPLLGAVLSVKDIIDVAGTVTSCCSHSRDGAAAAGDARLVRRLRDAGAVVVGKANCHEFAFGGPSFDLPFPPARNPWNADLFPGGSSSGSGVGVGAGFCNGSIGTDTAGSIRLPATHCGVTGLKPTYGAVSLAGVEALSLTMDTAGPLARGVSDCRAIFAAIRARGPGPDAARRQRSDLSGFRLGLVDDAWGFASRFEPWVAGDYARVSDLLREAGAAMVPLNPPAFERIHAAASVVMMAEVAALHGPDVRARFDRFGTVFRQRALVGELLSARQYLQAAEERSRLVAEFSLASAGVDAVLMPGSFRLAAPLRVVDTFYFLKDPNINAVASVLGRPALALPTGLSPDGIPTGIQLMGPPGSDDLLLDAGQVVEGLLDFARHFAPPAASS